MKYKVFITWSESATIEVEADSLIDAIDAVWSGEDDFPARGTYIDDSMEVDYQYSAELNGCSD